MGLNAFINTAVNESFSYEHATLSDGLRSRKPKNNALKSSGFLSRLPRILYRRKFMKNEEKERFHTSQIHTD